MLYTGISCYGINILSYKHLMVNPNVNSPVNDEDYQSIFCFLVSVKLQIK